MTLINYALGLKGATASSSSNFGTTLPAYAINGVRHTNGAYLTNSWLSNAATGTFTVAFGQPREIENIKLFGLANPENYSTDPPNSATSIYANDAFTVEYSTNGTTWTVIPGGTVTSNGDLVVNNFSFSPLTATHIRIVITANSSGNAALVEVEAWSPPFEPLLPVGVGCELYVEPQLDSAEVANGANAASLTDYSGKARHLTAVSNYPVFQIPSVNGRAGVYWDGTKNPLKNTASFAVKCGFMAVKINETTNFSNYAGILTDTVSFPILVGHSGTNHFYDNLQQAYLFEFRSNDRIYSRTSETGVFNAPAPINTHKIIFFRYWKPITVTGVQIGQDRTDTARKAKMSFTLLALYSSDFCESEIRAKLQTLATTFGLTLADVYPYQADVDNTPEHSAQSVNFYDPPEGDRISEVLNNRKRVIDLKFSGADQTEVEAMMKFHDDHYAPALPCIYRDYRFTPPRDIEGYINSPYDLDGSMGDFTYGFNFKEK